MSVSLAAARVVLLVTASVAPCTGLTTACDAAKGSRVKLCGVLQMHVHYMMVAMPDIIAYVQVNCFDCIAIASRG
jgi:hypothetical protein